MTRVTNACVLIHLGPYTLLTDPWFRRPWGFWEDPGLDAADLPELTAVLGSHWAPDHWDMSSLSAVPNKDKIPVYASTNSMVRRAKRHGFARATTLLGGESAKITDDLSIEALEDHAFMGMPTNNYVVTYGGVRVFYGGETRDLDALMRYRRENARVDVVIAPTNGMTLLGVQLVATAEEALESAKILEAQVLFPIHDSMRPMGFGGPTSSTRELLETSPEGVRIVVGRAGECLAAS